jgi:predicted dinucleotide-binding enzyme
MVTAVVGLGNIGKSVARDLVDGGERVVLASRDEADALALAEELGALATGAPVGDAIAQADAVILALWLNDTKEVIAEHGASLAGKVVIDTSNPVAFDDKGQMSRTLPDGISAGSVVSGLLPGEAHYVKAFGTISADSLGSEAKRTPERVVLFYATDDAQGASTAQRLISVAGFDPVSAGGVSQALRIEIGGDLHQVGLDGRLLNRIEADSALDG